MGNKKPGWRCMGLQFLFIASIVSFSFLYAAQVTTKGKLTGEVTDAKTGVPLYGANVMVQGTLLGSSADASGLFSIDGIPVGRYSIEVSMMGYAKQAQTIGHGG